MPAMSLAVGGSAASLTLVVPLFNEEERVSERGPELAAFVARLAPGSELVFVDDGSTDATVEAVEKVLSAWPDLRGRLLRRPHEGKGGAVMEGLRDARADYAGFCDVDLSTGLEQLEQLLEAATMTRVLAIGSRDVVGSRLIRRQSAVREILGRGYNRAVQLTLAPGISDTQCGAKIASTKVWRELIPHCREKGFAWDVELIAVARRRGIVVREIGVEWRHDDRSRVRVARDGAAMLLALARIWRNARHVPVAGPSAPTSVSVFNDAQASTLIESDTDHWWFRSKAALVASALRRHAAHCADRRLVDVGAGAGGTTTLLGLPPRQLISIDGSEVLCRQARRRHALLTAVAMAEAIPLRDGAAGMVTLLDVIEHLDRPEDVLREVRRVLASDGRLVVNVPAHSWLWSSADVYLGHRRRYTRRLLRQQLQDSGFRIVWLSHVFSWLVLPVWLARRLQSDAQRQLGLDRAGALIDAAALVLTRLERTLVRWCPLPLGTSILCVAAKEDGEAAAAAPWRER
jgi:dolichyl-phosphate beta-glucosyltransferase